MRRFFMIFTCAFSVACGDGKTEVENDISCVVINPDRRDVIQVSDFVESVEYIKLEATPESLLKHVDKVYVMDNQLFVADYATKSIYIYMIKPGIIETKFQRLDEPAMNIYRWML